MKKIRVYHANQAFLDVLFICLLIFMPLVVIAVIMMNEKDPKKKVSEAKAEFMIIVDWDYQKDDDVDTYVEDPNGKLVFFRRREDGLMHLDRDDLGWQNDKVRLPNGTITEVKLNREVVSLRGIIPGEYIVNVHLYSIRSKPPAPVPVTIRLEKMNPYSIVTVKEVTLEAVGREITAFRFTLDKDGVVTNVNELEKKIATNIGQNGNHNWQETEDPNAYDEENLE